MPEYMPVTRRRASYAARATMLLVAVLAAGCQSGEALRPPPRTAPDVPVRVDVPAPDSGYHPTSDVVALPQVQREFRGVWVATVGNLDWPSRRSLTTQQAQQELLRILDNASDHGLNAVILQVRPMGDAFYDSDLEPWSDYLTGASGRAPQPAWDPLAFAIAQAHARGLELHAWFNPFRAGFVAKRTTLADNHVSRARPDLVVRYGTHYWVDPGIPEARRRALDVIRDVVRRYDIDGVHIDDYFYPYQERDARDRLIQFPDDASFERYGAPTGMSRADWRRSNIDTFVEQLYAVVHDEKQHVRVGISPFGIWRPGSPPGVQGLDSYAELFADSRKWLRSGWADYFVPQLYWRTRAPQQDYVALLDWWTTQNVHGRHLWPGLHPNRIGPGSNAWPVAEIAEQVELTRANGRARGNVHFSASSLMRNAGGVTDTLRTRFYAEPALTPASPWLSTGRLARPRVSARLDTPMNATSVEIATSPDAVSSWIIHSRFRTGWVTDLMPAAAREFSVGWRGGEPPDLVAVVPVDRAGVEGDAALLRLGGTAPEDERNDWREPR